MNDPHKFGTDFGSDNAPEHSAAKIGVKSPGYLRMNAATRRAAKLRTELVGIIHRFSFP